MPKTKQQLLAVIQELATRPGVLKIKEAELLVKQCAGFNTNQLAEICVGLRLHNQSILALIKDKKTKAQLKQFLANQ